MNEQMGSIIMRLRKEKGLTQEQLASELGISYQAVSKWETGNSCPDITALPLLADLFSVSIDELFGRAPEAPLVPAEAMEPAEPAQKGPALPWPDDDTFYAVLFHGHELIGSRAEDPRALRAQQSFRFEYEGPAQNVYCTFDAEINGPVSGDVEAGGDLSCGAVGGSVCAGGDVNCESVEGGVAADGDVTCDEVSGGVEAKGDVSCGDVGGAVNAGGDVSCDAVCGNINAGGDVSCDEVQGNVSAGGDVSCDSVGGAAFAGGDLGAGKEFAADLSEGIGEMAAWGAELGRRISETVEKKLGKQWSVHKSWPFGKHNIRVDMDLDLDEEERDDDE